MRHHSHTIPALVLLTSLTVGGLVVALAVADDGASPPSRPEAPPTTGKGQPAPENLYDAANRAFVMENYTEAQELYRQVLLNEDLAGLHDRALFLMARCYRERGEWPAAESAVSQLVEDYPESDILDDAYYFVGSYYAAETPEKNLQVAIEYFEMLLDRFPTGDKAPAAHFRLGELAAETGQWSKAIETFERLQEADLPERLAFDARFALAEAYRNPRNMQRDLEAAQKVFEEIMNEYPERGNSPQVLFALGCTHRDLKEHDAAIRVFDRLLRQYPNSLFAQVATPLLAKCHEERRERIMNQLVRMLQKSKRATVSGPPSDERANAILQQLKSAARVNSDEPSSRQKIEIVADKEDGQHWRGNVRVGIADVTVTADEVRYDDLNGKLIADGNVALQRADLLEAECKRMTLDLRNSTVELMTRVTVRRKGETPFVGDRVRLSLADNQILN